MISSTTCRRVRCLHSTRCPALQCLFADVRPLSLQGSARASRSAPRCVTRSWCACHATSDLPVACRPTQPAYVRPQFYAISQKEGLGFDKAVEEAKARMSRYQVTPNMLIVPPQLLLYMATAPEEKIKCVFCLACVCLARGSPRVLPPTTGFRMRARRGRRTLRAACRATRRGPSAGWASTRRCRTRCRTTPTRCRCCSARRRWASFTGSRRRRRTGRASSRRAGATLSSTTRSSTATCAFRLRRRFARATSTTRRLRTSTPRHCEQGRERLGVPATDVSLGGLSAGELGQKGSTQKILDEYNGGKWMPIGIVLARPFIEHLMMSAVMAVAGRDTGDALRPGGCALAPLGLCTLPRSRPSHAASACARRHADLGEHVGEDDRGPRELALPLPSLSQRLFSHSLPLQTVHLSYKNPSSPRSKT